MKKVILFLTTIFLLVFFLTDNNQIYAKKRIVRSGGKVVTRSAGNRLIITPRLRKDRQALIVSFSNLKAVSDFTYELEYESEGIAQGVAGTITPSGETSTSRELLFGTCSKNVCRYHKKIKNMKLTVTSTLTGGTRVRKTFKIKA